jgi:hypothetical protein
MASAAIYMGRLLYRSALTAVVVRELGPPSPKHCAFAWHPSVALVETATSATGRACVKTPARFDTDLFCSLFRALRPLGSDKIAKNFALRDCLQKFAGFSHGLGRTLPFCRRGAWVPSVKLERLDRQTEHCPWKRGAPSQMGLGARSRDPFLVVSSLFHRREDSDVAQPVRPPMTISVAQGPAPPFASQ